jgi:hypothetical protein
VCVTDVILEGASSKVYTQRFAGLGVSIYKDR